MGKHHAVVQMVKALGNLDINKEEIKMCGFFSFDSDGFGKTYYFDWVERKKLLTSNPKKYKPDSHTSIASFFNLKEDKLNKYEYNPLLKEFKVDQVNGPDDYTQAERWVRGLDFKKIVKPLIIKPIINPLKIKPLRKISLTDKSNLEKWASVVDSVGDSVLDSIEASVGDSVLDSIEASVGDSVWYSIEASVWDSIGVSIWDSMEVYLSSFFEVKYKHDFSSCINLLDRGFVPSFDGKTWRLHQGGKAKIVYEMVI